MWEYLADRRYFQSWGWMRGRKHEVQWERGSGPSIEGWQHLEIRKRVRRPQECPKNWPESEKETKECKFEEEECDQS